MTGSYNWEGPQAIAFFQLFSRHFPGTLDFDLGLVLPIQMVMSLFLLNGENSYLSPLHGGFLFDTIKKLEYTCLRILYLCPKGCMQETKQAEVINRRFLLCQ